MEFILTQGIGALVILGLVLWFEAWLLIAPNTRPEVVRQQKTSLFC